MYYWRDNVDQLENEDFLEAVFLVRAHCFPGNLLRSQDEYLRKIPPWH